MRKIYLAMMIALTVMLAPNLAYAEELDAGLEQREPISQTEYDNMPTLGLLGDDAGTRSDPAETPITAAQYVQQPIERMWFVNGSENDMVYYVALFLRGANGFLLLSGAVGLVFFWWGLRKATQVLLSAFRKGKINL